MTRTLALSPDLRLPLDATTQKLAWIGRTGSGKTYGAGKLAEEMLDAGVQVVIIDPVGVWWGLRLAADGTSPGIAIPVFGGLHGDLPLEATAGAYLADLVVDRALAVVLDLSQFEFDTDKARFGRDFANRFFFRKKQAPSAVHLFLEECQEFVPQNPQKGEEQMLHAFQRLNRLGRNFGIGTSLITQRPQDVNKKALNQAECVFALQLTGPQERKAVAEWIREKGLDQDLVNDLPKLKVGTAHVWSPAWLEISKLVAIGTKRTFNASSTPTVGQRAQARELAPIDLATIRAEMAATIEKAQAEDPKLLRGKIVALERALAAAKKAPAVHVEHPAPPQVERVMVPMLTEEHLAALRTAAQVIQQTFAGARGLVEQLTEHRGALTDALRRIDVAIAQATKPGARPALAARSPVPVLAPHLREQNRTPARVPASRESGLSGVEQRILDAIAELELLGAATPTRELVAFLAGYAHINSKGFSNGIGALRSSGLLEYGAGGMIALTAAGRDRAQPPPAPRTAAELQERVIAKLGGASGRILRPLLEAYPAPVARDALVVAADYGHANSKGFTNALGRLRTLGFVEYPAPGQVRAAPVLFLEGAA